jgi:cytochrome P450
MDVFQTVSSMSALFFALVLFPEVQKRAQAELDSVISRDRLPTYDDKPRLPYIEAMSKELLRWHMVTPMGANLKFSLSSTAPCTKISMEVYHTR